MYSSSPSGRPKRTRSYFFNKGKGDGKGKGKSKSGKGKGKGERVVPIEGHATNCQNRSNDKKAETEHDMLSTVLPEISNLSVRSTDTLFEVLSMGAKLSSADVEKYLRRPNIDRKRLVLVLYKERWEEDAAFRNTWPDDKSELTSFGNGHVISSLSEPLLEATHARSDLSSQVTGWAPTPHLEMLRLGKPGCLTIQSLVKLLRDGPSTGLPSGVRLKLTRARLGQNNQVTD